jgi:hypothetical protein
MATRLVSGAVKSEAFEAERKWRFQLRPFVWFVALIALLNAASMRAQDPQRIDPCKAMPAPGSPAAKSFLTFDAFDKELRDAIAKQDTVALAFLVTFPLRVNDAGGTISLDDPAALKTHFQEVFTAAVRKEILSEKNDEVACNAEGIGYARGVIWVNASDRGYAIWSVNRDAVPPYRTDAGSTARVNYICQTQTHRIVIDTAVGGALRYRSWNKPRLVTGEPDLVIARGVASFEGSNVCAFPIYTFKNSFAVYRVEGGLGCFGDSGGPPSWATGRIEITVKGKPATDSWCY